MRWNFGFQHELSKDLMLEVVYMGNHAVHLPIAFTQLNVIPRQYPEHIADSRPDADQFADSDGDESVRRPGARHGLNNSTTTVQQLLRAVSRSFRWAKAAAATEWWSRI